MHVSLLKQIRFYNCIDAPGQPTKSHS